MDEGWLAIQPVFRHEGCLFTALACPIDLMLNLYSPPISEHLVSILIMGAAFYRGVLALNFLFVPFYMLDTPVSCGSFLIHPSLVGHSLSHFPYTLVSWVILVTPVSRGSLFIYMLDTPESRGSFLIHPCLVGHS